MKRVMVTGASGFIGRHCLGPLAARGYEVIPVGKAECNLLDTQALRRFLEQVRPTHLLHLAWYTEHGKFWSAKENLSWVAATLELYSAFAAIGGQRFVGTGTCAEYAWSESPLREGVSELRPTTLYGVAKKNLQELLSYAAAQSQISFAWGRVFLLFGPGEAGGRFIPSVICPLLAGRPAILSDGRQIRDFLHAEDVATALVALLDSEVTGPTNIASGTGHTLADVARMIGIKLGRPDLIQLGARPANPGDPSTILANVSKLRSLGTWVPKYSLDSGLDSVINWWRTQSI